MAKPIRLPNGEKELNTQVLTVHAPLHKLNQSKRVDKLQESETLAEQLESVCPSKLRIGNNNSRNH